VVPQAHDRGSQTGALVLRSGSHLLTYLIFLTLVAPANADRDDVSSESNIPYVDARESIRYAATYSVPLGAEVLILPESAFLEALQDRKYAPAPEEQRQRAADLGSQGNSPSSIGIVGRFRSPEAEPLTFEGDLFIVARDAQRIAQSEELQVKDYFIAAVSMKGTTPWYAIGDNFAMKGAAGFNAGRCCGPRRQCSWKKPEPPSPMPGPGPCSPMGGRNLCPPDTEVGWDRNPAEQVREQMGEGAISTQIYGPPDSGARLDLSCAPPLGQRDPCAVIRPNCEPSGGEPDGSATINKVCGDQPVTVRNVPRICTIVTTWDTLPAECGGYCSQCGYDNQLRRVLPLLCGAKMPVDPDSAVCNPDKKRDAEWNRRLMTIASCTSFHRCRHCEQAMKDGSKLCTECNIKGECQQYVDRPRYDPRAEGSDSSSDDETKRCDRFCSCGDTTQPAGCQCMGAPICPDDTTPSSGGTTPEVPSDQPPKPAAPAGPGSAAAVQTPAPYLPGLGGVDDRPAKREPVEEVDKPSAQQATTVQGSPAKLDPILLGDGSFHIQQTDLSFDGPVRPLAFVRTYNSRSNLRGSLGSNWHHSWETRIEPLHEGNLPAWAAAYCAGSPTAEMAVTPASATPSVTPSPSGTPAMASSTALAASNREITCVLYHSSDASVRLFILDKGSGLFMPQAGSTDTILQTVETTSVSCTGDNDCASGQRCNEGKCRLEPSGWALRTANGDILSFNKEGFLVEDRDRFGNGFIVEYESTPYYELYDYYCLQPKQSLDSKQCEHRHLI